jgi:hypothetical protein
VLGVVGEQVIRHIICFKFFLPLHFECIEAKLIILNLNDHNNTCFMCVRRKLSLHNIVSVN